MKSPSPDACPCGLGPTYGGCCGRFIADGVAAPTAAALMRSRYTAYVREDADYMLATWHVSTRPSALTFDPPAPRWLGLDVRVHAKADAVNASVEFVARYRLAGRAHRLHERSRFVLDDGRWYYIDGQMPA